MGHTLPILTLDNECIHMLDFQAFGSALKQETTGTDNLIQVNYFQIEP